MVLEYESPIRVYKYPFELVMKAYERRFPTCHLIPVFIGSEILSEHISADNSRIITERRCKVHVDIPYLLKKLVGIDYVWFLQKNDLDLKMRTLVIEARNESFSNRVTVNENCRYFVHPENNDWTCYEQNAMLEIHSFFGFESTIEKLAMKQYAQNIACGKEVIEYFIKQLKEEGITSAPIWSPQVSEDNNDSEKSVKCPNGNATMSTNNNEAVTAKVNDLSLSSKLNRQGSITSTSPTGECQYVLEADYITRYLGELTPLQESKLVQLKKCFAHHKGKVPSDTTLLRFLRACDFNLEKAKESLSRTFMWRKKHNVDQILCDYEMSQVIKDYYPGSWHYHDKDSQPLYILKLGQTDVKGLLKSVGEHELLKLTMHICEEGLKLTEEATRVSGKPITTWCLLVDLEGLNMRHYWRPGIKALLRIIEILEENYPETLGRVLIVRAPRVFPILWTIVSTFIDERTRSKFLIYAGNDYQAPGGLIDYIDTSIVPDFLGGPCDTKICNGGIVPKNLYLPENNLDHENFMFGEDSIYQSITLIRGQVYDAVISVKEPGCVITWDFDVMREDVAFSVFYVKKDSINIEATPMNPNLKVGECRTVIDKSLTENEDYERVEPTTICHDGDSIQGSHIAQHPGTYILEWKYNQSIHNYEIGGTHKAQIMFYYEVLDSANYKGSMTSLQSAHSGFSSLDCR